MSLYMALLVQRAEGCDYAIDCGKKLIQLQAKSRENALTELKTLIVGRPELYDPEYSDFYSDELEGEYWHSEYRLKQCVLFEVKNAEDISINTWYEEAERIIQNKLDEDKEQRDREEYERLRQKYEN